MSKGKILEKLRSLGKARVIFGILLVCWMPWGVFCFPGNLPWDAGTSIAWFLNLDRSNVNNPWFQNLWMGLFFQAGNLLGLPKLGIYLASWTKEPRSAGERRSGISAISRRARGSGRAVPSGRT